MLSKVNHSEVLHHFGPKQRFYLFDINIYNSADHLVRETFKSTMYEHVFPVDFFSLRSLFSGDKPSYFSSTIPNQLKLWSSYSFVSALKIIQVLLCQGSITVVISSPVKWLKVNLLDPRKSFAIPVQVKGHVLSVKCSWTCCVLENHIPLVYLCASALSIPVSGLLNVPCILLQQIYQNLSLWGKTTSILGAFSTCS